MNPSKHTQKVEDAIFEIRKRVLTLKDNLKMNKDNEFIQNRRETFIQEASKKYDLKEDNIRMVLTGEY